ncbi:GreA/GreB family elongation factor [Joostella sp. CR20]|uniref:GreA/GreB family elongation factor n=1 Tax=Joostella sp. CR20 TaxID=2804312 RepID=UPI00313BECD0
MKSKQLVIEKKEFVQLKQLLSLTNYNQDLIFKKSIAQLIDELSDAVIVDENEMPESVVRFNSIVEVTLDNGWEKKFELVTSHKSDLNSGKISVLSPMGASVFGRQQNDTFQWEFPSGIHQLKISFVTQNKLSDMSEMI